MTNRPERELLFYDTERHLRGLAGKPAFVLKKLQEDSKAQTCRTRFVADQGAIPWKDRPMFD
jgi:hypothetical protein